MDVDRLIPRGEFMQLARLGHTRFHEEVRAGRLQAVKNGARTFVRASEARRYLDALQPIRRAA